MIRNIALIQCSFTVNPHENLDKILYYMQEAREHGAEIIVLPELFLGPYFCKVQDDSFFSWASTLENNHSLLRMQEACRALKLVAPFSFFERLGPHYYNSAVLIDATGEILGIYRKSHIPDGPGYQEKYYFRPGNTGFQVFNSRYGKIGLGICWDQWFPEAARIMALKGADFIMYPTAIGSEPNAPFLCTKEPWRRVMTGHAVANMIPLAAANRIGVEDEQLFYGQSFIINELGDCVASCDENEGVVLGQLDFERAHKMRASFGFFRDRRTELYEDLLA
jgi:N-carbamoylputrescine amidase